MTTAGVFRRLLTRVAGERVTATFLVTVPDPSLVRADLYCLGAAFSDARVAFFDWSFTVRTRRQTWDRFAATSRLPLQQLSVSQA